MKPGRIRTKLAKMLDVDPVDIWQNCNAWVGRMGLCRWGVGKYHSFDTMSDCIKYGYDICDYDNCILSKDIT